MEFFTSIEQVRECVKIDQTVLIESMTPYFQDAETTYLHRYTTAELADLVKAEIETPGNATLAKLVPYMRRVVAHFSILLAYPDYDIRMQEMGMTTSQNNNFQPASAARVDRFVSNREKMGYMAVESLLRFLEANKADYPVWANSECCTIFNSTLIKTADEFDRLVNIKGSRLLFFDYRTAMEDAETLKVASDITEEYLAALKSRQNANTLTAADLKVLPLIKRAVANFTHFSHNPTACNYESTACLYLGQAKRILWAHPDDYPEFKTSPSYFDRTNFEKFENDSEKAIFIAGAGG